MRRRIGKLQETRKELASTTKELNRAQERLAEKSRQKMVADREAQEPSEEVKKLKILLEEAFDQVKRLERESGAAVAQAVDSKKQAVDSKKSAMKADAEKKEVLEKLRAKEKELAAEKKARKKAEAVLQKKL